MGGKTYTDIDRDDFQCGKNRREIRGKRSVEVSEQEVEEEKDRYYCGASIISDR